jgi:leader peptidase (prepilin peptidase) / N-methyltransferase
MTFSAAILVILMGLSVGSFLNVVITRLGKKRGILLGKSECPDCGHRLKWYDLLPVASFLLLRGKCRYCKNRISRLYPAVEILTAVSFAAYFYFRGLTGSDVLIDLLIISGLVIILVFDLRELLIPDKIVLPLTVVALLFYLPAPDISLRLTTALATGLLFAIMYWMSRGRSIGLGDAKLAFLMGLTLGYPLGALAVLFSVWAAALVGIALIAAKKASMKTALPLGAFLATASIIFIILEHELQQIFQVYF